MNKKGIELSVNFIVILILSLTILGLSMAFLSQINKAGKNQLQVNEAKMQAEVEKIMADSNDALGIAYPVVSINPGQGYVLTVGLRNKISTSEEDIFKYNATPIKYIDPDGIEASLNLNAEFDQDEMSISLNEIQYKLILFEDLELGTYIYKIGFYFKDSNGDFNEIDSSVFTINVE